MCYTEYKQLSKEREYGADDLMENEEIERGGGGGLQKKKREIEGESERISYGPQNTAYKRIYRFFFGGIANAVDSVQYSTVQQAVV